MCCPFNPYFDSIVWPVKSFGVVDVDTKELRTLMLSFKFTITNWISPMFHLLYLTSRMYTLVVVVSGEMFSLVQISEDIVNCIQRRRNEKRQGQGSNWRGVGGFNPPVHGVTPISRFFYCWGVGYSRRQLITWLPIRDLHGPGGPRAGPGLDIKSRSRAGPDL